MAYKGEAFPFQNTCFFRQNDVIHAIMSALFEKAIEKVRALPLEMQEDLARVLLQFAGEELPIIDLTPEEEEAVLNSRAAAARGEFATDEQIRAIWAKHGL
jgi:hypothetical protein